MCKYHICTHHSNLTLNIPHPLYIYIYIANNIDESTNTK